MVLFSNTSFNFGVINCCKKCKSNQIIKSGKTSNNKQRFFCKSCSYRFIDNYTYKAYQQNINDSIIALTKESVSIRGTARLLGISPTTLLSRIINISRNIVQPPIAIGKIFQVDEMRTFIKRKDKLIWIVCALEQETKRIVSFNIGRRTNKTLYKVICSLEL